MADRGQVLAGSVWCCARITVQSHYSVFGLWCSLLCAWCPDSCRVELKHLPWSTFLVLLFLGGRTVLVHAGCMAELMQLVSNLLNQSWWSVSDCKWQSCTFSLKSDFDNAFVKYLQSSRMVWGGSMIFNTCLNKSSSSAYSSYCKTTLQPAECIVINFCKHSFFLSEKGLSLWVLFHDQCWCM